METYVEVVPLTLWVTLTICAGVIVLFDSYSGYLAHIKDVEACQTFAEIRQIEGYYRRRRITILPIFVAFFAHTTILVIAVVLRGTSPPLAIIVDNGIAVGDYGGVDALPSCLSERPSHIAPYPWAKACYAKYGTEQE
jgi:hypothetical protein